MFRAVVGPMASAEVRNLKSYADGNRIVMCSLFSTAPDFAVPDYIFRDIPNDRYLGESYCEAHVQLRNTICI